VCSKRTFPSPRAHHCVTAAQQPAHARRSERSKPAIRCAPFSAPYCVCKNFTPPRNPPVTFCFHDFDSAVTAPVAEIASKMESIGQNSDDFLSSREFDCEAWRDALRPDWGQYNPAADIDSKCFAGRAHRQSSYGFVAMNISCNAHRVERTQRDVRLDGVDHYAAIFQVVGCSILTQNDQQARLGAGDVVLVDSARPVTFVNESSYGQWFSLQLPRQALVSHLGVEPVGGLCRRGETRVARLLFDLIREPARTEASAFAPAVSYTQLAVYDLIGALFVLSDPAPVSRHTDRMFVRICGIIKDRVADPDFGPCEAAIEAGISLRYLQKLFTQRGLTCSDFIYSLRLDRAARLLHRRKFLGIEQPVSEVAYACGFRDYPHFARKFRQRFGCSPGAHSAADALAATK
jgi:AraC family transcriptional regulator, positive regulator of tynA and feaB